MHKESDFDIDGKVKSDQLRKQWYYLLKNRGECGSPYVAEILDIRTLGILQKSFQGRKKRAGDVRTTLFTETASKALSGWLIASKDINIWRSSRWTHNVPGDWNEMSLWWRDVWTLWHHKNDTEQCHYHSIESRVAYIRMAIPRAKRFAHVTTTERATCSDK